MIEIERRIYIFKKMEIWFSDSPFDVERCHFVSFGACKNPTPDETFTCEQSNTLIIDLSQDLDKIWTNMGKKSCRYSIKRAIRENIQVKKNQNYRQFYHINRAFKKTKGWRTFRSMDRLERIKDCTLFTAEIDGEVVAGQTYVEDESHIRWVLGASKRLEVDRDKSVLIGCANRLMSWEAIKYAKEKGIREFDMGGYYMGEDETDSRYTVNTYKKSFGGILVDRYTCTKSYSPWYDIAAKLFTLGKRLHLGN